MITVYRQEGEGLGSRGPDLLLIFGAGGHGRVVADVFLRRFPGADVAFLDDGLAGHIINGRLVEGRLADWQKVLERSGRQSAALILGLGDNVLRREWALKIASANSDYPWLTLKDPSSVVSATAAIGPGTVLVPQSVVNANASVGAHVILNTSCSVDHDCRLGDFVHVAPGSRLAGGVIVGEGTHIGVGATIIPGVKIGAWSLIGAGSVVVNDIPDGVVAYGVPARVQRRLTSGDI